MVDQLPADPVVVQIAQHRRIRRALHVAILPIGDTGHLEQRCLALQRLHQRKRRLLALAAHDEVDLRAVTQDLVPVVGRVHAAIHHPSLRQLLLEQTAQLDHRDMHRAGAGMAEHQYVRLHRDGTLHDLVE